MWWWLKSTITRANGWFGATVKWGGYALGLIFVVVPIPDSLQQLAPWFNAKVAGGILFGVVFVIALFVEAWRLVRLLSEQRKLRLRIEWPIGWHNSRFLQVQAEIANRSDVETTLDRYWRVELLRESGEQLHAGRGWVVPHERVTIPAHQVREVEVQFDVTIEEWLANFQTRARIEVMDIHGTPCEAYIVKKGKSALLV